MAWVQQGWAFAAGAAREAGAAWVAASAKCKAVITHSASRVFTVCGGFDEEMPVLFTPGFGPFALAWGWCLVGIVLGLLLGLHFWDFVSKLDQLAQRLERVRRVAAAVPDLFGAPPGLAAIPPWHGAVQLALAQVTDPNRRIILRRLLDDGEPALQFLAASTGSSRRRALEALLGGAVVQQHATEWQL